MNISTFPKRAGGRARFSGKVTMQLLKMNSVAGRPHQHVGGAGVHRKVASFQEKVRDSKTDRQLRLAEVSATVWCVRAARGLKQSRIKMEDCVENLEAATLNSSRVCSEWGRVDNTIGSVNYEH